MHIINATEARKNLYKLMDQTAENHEPTIITGRRNDSVIMSKEDYENLMETLYVMQNKEVYNSLIDGKKISYNDCTDEIEW